MPTSRSARGANVVSVANDIAGFHVGWKWASQFGRRAGIETYGKLDVYANTVIPQSIALGWSDNSQGSFVAAGGINLTYKLNRRLTSYVGYDLTQITGVERGQLLLGRARCDDGVLISGMTLGMD